eukprot:TRINITY_DN3627_c0_g1_i4.p1 TRINITY_DN3627_c0_g1~~TRINITY_DN3627_c0_g1_i4.p1  ORF type:complete len:140 (+),score=2.97 TRINITY_DN3627_c0_g1_i4:1-420(+)
MLEVYCSTCRQQYFFLFHVSSIFPPIDLSMCFFSFNDTASTEIYTILFVGSVRCVQETALTMNRQLSSRLLLIIIWLWGSIISHRHRHCSLPHHLIHWLLGHCSLSHKLVPHVLCVDTCLLYTSPSPRDRQKSRMPSSA